MLRHVLFCPIWCQRSASIEVNGKDGDYPRSPPHREPVPIVTLPDSSPGTKKKHKTTLRVISWNIERGLELEGIVRALRHVDADVLLLQEVDVGCNRTHKIDVAAHLASALEGIISYAYVKEFDEHAQGLGAHHGNAILSKVPLTQAWAVRDVVRPFHWERLGATIGEPRSGARVALGALLGSELPIEVWSLHLENFCSPLERWAQLEASSALPTWEARRVGRRTVLAGDLNTAADSCLVRWLPTYWGPCVPNPEGEVEYFRRRLRSEWNLDDPSTEHTMSALWGCVKLKLDWLASDLRRNSPVAVGGDGLSDHRFLHVDYLLV